MTQAPENDAMAIDLTGSRAQSPAPEVAATLRATSLQSPMAFRQGEWPYPTTTTATATSNGDKGQQQPGSYKDATSNRVPVPTLKRKITEEEQPRKKEFWVSPPSSSVTFIRPTIASIIAALRDDTQERDARREPSNNVGTTTVTTITTTTTAPVTAAKETEVEKKAEVVCEGRAQHPEVRPRPNHKAHNGKSNVQYQTHWKEWCIRKEFSDGDWVTREKFVSYLRELTAPQSYTDSDIPRLSIKPLFVKSRDGSDVRRASLGTLEAYMRAVQSLYKDQCLVDGIIPNDSLGKTEVEMILKEYENLLSYTTLKKAGDGEYEDDEQEEEEEDDANGDDGADEDNVNGANASREGSAEQEELSRKEIEASSTALSVQGSRQQSDNVQETTKVDTTKKKKSKRSGRALSPVSQRQDPHFVFAGTTQRHHLTHQTHWKEWCIRKRYADGHRVTAAKFTAFAKELTARDEYYDKDNPHLCIKPFIVNVHKGADARRASKGTVRSSLTAVRALYMDQCNFEKVKPNVTKDLAKTAIDDIMSDYEKLLKESPGLPRIVTPDGQVLPREAEIQPNESQEAAQQEGGPQEVVPQEIEPQEVVPQEIEPQEIETQEAEQQEAEQQEVDHREDTLQEVRHEDVDQVSPRNEDSQGSDTSRDPSLIRLKRIMKSLWNPRHSSRAQSWVIAHRDRLRLAFGFFETDSRNVLSALLPSQIYHMQIWPEDETQTPAQGIAVVVDSRKPYGDPLRYSLFLREEDVQVCPVGALAFFLLAKWTEKKSFPDFDTDEWSTEPIESFMEAPKAGDNASSEQEGWSSSVAKFAGIIGANVEERPYRSFFNFLKPSPNRQQNHNRKIPPILLTTTLPQPSVFRLPRNRLLPPPDLQRQLFPFVEDFNDDSADWKMWVENIMMDRPETANRLSEKDRDTEYFKVDYPLIRHLLFVAGLRKVILQDFAAMMACETEENGEKKTGFDHAFAVRHPVLSSQAFREYAVQLREAMAADPIVKAKVSTEDDEPAEDEMIQSLEVQESVPTSKTTTSTKTITKPTTTSVVRNLRKGDKSHSGSSTSDMSSSIDAARVSVAAGSHDQHNETDRLLEAIQELCARVASLEQMENQETELSTPASATASTKAQFPIDITLQDKDTSRDMDTTMDIDMDVDADGDIRNSDGEDDADCLRRENQNLRDKVAALERANRELAEQNERQSSSSHTPELHVLSTPGTSALRSRVVSMAHCDNTQAYHNNTHTPNGRSSSRSAAASPNPISVVRNHRATTSITTATIPSSNNNNNTIRNRNRRSISSSCSSCGPSSLRQEVQDLRNQLESLEQEEQEALDYAAAAIESVELLDNKVLQIEQSMHGLWTMIARNEAAKFAAAASSPGPRSPVLDMGMASPPPPPPIFTKPATAATVGGHQYQDPYSRAGAGTGARLRVDTLPLRSRMTSSGSAGSGSGGIHGETRS